MIRRALAWLCRGGGWMRITWMSIEHPDDGRKTPNPTWVRMPLSKWMETP